MMTVEEYYQNVINKVLAKREERRKQYGDKWVNDPIDYDIWMLWGKVGRAIHLLKKENENEYEKLEDTLIDLVNYALFALTKIDLDKMNLLNEKDRNL